MAKLHLSESARKFVREVGSIVLGVLIALGIGEMADKARWYARAAKSTRAMNVELARAAGVLDERVLAQPCLDRRIEELDRIVRAALASGSLPDIGEIGGPPLRPVQTAAWDDAVGSGTLLHINDRKRSQLSLDYPLLGGYPQMVGQEAQLWATLHIIEAVPGRVSDDLLVEAAKTIALLRGMTRYAGLSARQMRDSIASGGNAPSYFLILDREGARKEIVDTIPSRTICRPLMPGKSGRTALR